MPLSDEVVQFNHNAVSDLDLDVSYLQSFVKRLEGQALMLPAVFDELRQTVDLLKSGNTDDFYDISIRMRKYTNVDPLNGPRLVEKLVPAGRAPGSAGGMNGGGGGPGGGGGGSGGGSGGANDSRPKTPGTAQGVSSSLLSSVTSKGFSGFR